VAESCSKGLRENALQYDLVFCVCVCMYVCSSAGLYLRINQSRTLIIIHIHLCFEIGLEGFHPHEPHVRGVSCKSNTDGGNETTFFSLLREVECGKEASRLKTLRYDKLQ